MEPAPRRLWNDAPLRGPPTVAWAINALLVIGFLELKYLQIVA
jgi:hypothetical protein